MANDTSSAFKNLINPQSVREIGELLGSARPAFRVDAFVAEAVAGLESLELKARVKHVAAALRRALSEDWGDALDHVVKALPPPMDGTDNVTAGLALWPLCQLVEDFGVDEPVLSLAAMPALTQRMSAEFAVRPFIQRHPELAFDALRRWASHPNVHVRRLVSEGSRPRLPWGLRLRAIQDDPQLTIPLLRLLVDDPELYVRRSVANHINDISKDHPAVAIALCRELLATPTDERTWLVHHALRGLIKAGDLDALEVVGIGPPKLSAVELRVEPTVTVGSKLQLAVSFRSLTDQKLVIDYILHRRLKSGKLSPKTFKWSTRTTRADQQVELTKAHSFRVVTTRVHYPGRHAIELMINGRRQGRVEFELMAE